MWGLRVGVCSVRLAEASASSYSRLVDDKRCDLSLQFLDKGYIVVQKATDLPMIP